MRRLALTVFRRRLGLVLLFGAAAFGAGLLWHKTTLRLGDGEKLIKGTVWQLDMATLHPAGNWNELGADSLLVQWSMVDGIGFTGNREGQGSAPDWPEIGREPWASQVILGLAGSFDEKVARSSALRLAKASAQIARQPPPLNVVGYYFPVEVDPSWKDAPKVMGKAFARLPRPLWISVYDGGNIGGAALADWLAEWLPGDVGIFFQDGVGVQARSPSVAREYMDALADKFGRQRVKVIVEAFRPLTPPHSSAPRFRATTAKELLPQITAMRGYDIYLFDGPRYVHSALVDDLRKEMSVVE